MVNLISAQAMFEYLCKLAQEHIETDDDQLVFDALQHNDIKHACQAIREVKTGEVEFQHLTLRFGARGEQSVYQFTLSHHMQYCLDLFSLYLAVRQIQFQNETFHPEMVSNVVVPIQIDALLWPPGARFLDQLVKFHLKAFKHIVPSLQGNDTLKQPELVLPLIAKLKGNAFALWFEVSAAQVQFEHLTEFEPDMIKLSAQIEDKSEHRAFLPIARFLRRYRYPWVAGRVSSQAELNRYRLLGAKYYFGYFSDIPTSLSFKSLEEN
ncbi:EAL domain-containing protein [Vibrio alfacsensis]|uniref:EAL domain-containing protein n=1 Tax=Vibrio alfacsensis TaxID=1074311 RepID=UPI0040688E58